MPEAQAARKEIFATSSDAQLSQTTPIVHSPNFLLGSVVVDIGDSTWHTKATAFLRCNVRSKSR